MINSITTITDTFQRLLLYSNPFLSLSREIKVKKTEIMTEEMKSLIIEVEDSEDNSNEDSSDSD